MNQIQRIENGLDKNGLLNTWNELEQQTDYVRGLILIELKTLWEDTKSGGEWSDFVKEFMIGGKSMSIDYIKRLMKTTREKAELSLISAKTDVDVRLGLKETEATLTLPESASTQMELSGENAVQKARNYNEVKEATGKDKPSAGEIRQFNKAKADAVKNVNDFAKQKAVPKLEKPDRFTSEEEIDFETWCISEHNIDVIKDKPEGARAIYALKDENVQTLFNRLVEWKSAYKIMAKLCHPDNGGNTLAMSMLNDFKSLMKSLEKISEIVEFENKIEKLKQEYSTPKIKGQ